LNMF